MNEGTPTSAPVGPSAILAIIKANDGQGSGIDADTIQGAAPLAPMIAPGVTGLPLYPSPQIAPRARVTEFRN